MKKLTTLLTVLFLMTGCLSFNVFASSEEKNVTVRIEGKSETYFYGSVKTTATNVTELMNQLDAENDKLTIKCESGSYGSYISKINNDAAGSVEPDYYDGWSDMINGKAPSVGIDSQEIKDGDVVVFYYSDEFGSHGFDKPEIDTSGITEGVVKFTSQGFDAEYKPVVNPVKGATVKWDEKTYTTDDNGEIKLVKEDMTPGSHSISISKVADDGMPLVLRFAPDEKITIEGSSKKETKNYTVLFVVPALVVVIIAATFIKKGHEK